MTDLIKRHNELKKEFNVQELKLIYCHEIDGEHTELNIHKNLEKTFCSSIYKMIKNENIEKTIISEETYIFSWLLLKNTYNILYRDYIMKDKLILLEKETELKKADTELKKADTELKKIELAIKETELKKMELEFELKKMELEFELKKMEIELKNNNNTKFL